MKKKFLYFTALLYIFLICVASIDTFIPNTDIELSTPIEFKVDSIYNIPDKSYEVIKVTTYVKIKKDKVERGYTILYQNKDNFIIDSTNE